MLPGVPRELRGMLADELLPIVRERAERAGGAPPSFGHRHDRRGARRAGGARRARQMTGVEPLVTAMRSPEDLLGRYALKPGWGMFCGTLAAQGGIRSATVFRMELEDPVRRRKLAHEYRIDVLPVEG
jgi:hypothetical protein